MVEHALMKHLSVPLLLLAAVGCGGTCSRSSQDTMLSQVGIMGELLVDRADYFRRCYGGGEGAHPERASWRAYCMTLFGDMDMPTYDRSEAWDSQVYAYLHKPELKPYLQIGEAGGAPDESADFLAVVGEGTAFAALADLGGEATSQLPRDTVLLVAAKSPSGSHWMECSELDVVDLVGPDDAVLKALPESPTPCGRIVHFVDGQTWLLQPTVPEELLYKLFTVRGASQHDRDELLADYLIRRRLPSVLEETVTFSD